MTSQNRVRTFETPCICMFVAIVYLTQHVLKQCELFFCTYCTLVFVLVLLSIYSVIFIIFSSQVNRTVSASLLAS
jgi:hypothetical protein